MKEAKKKWKWLINVSLYFNFRSIFFGLFISFSFCFSFSFHVSEQREEEREREGNNKTSWTKPPSHGQWAHSMGGWRALMNERIEIFS